jgi:hypothetical protein
LVWLRSYSNYLTPRTGVTSADTWTAVSLTLRNLLLNWFVILTPLCALVIFLKFVGVLSNSLILWFSKNWRLSPSNPWTFYFLVGIEIFAGVAGLVLLTWGLKMMTEGRPGTRAAEYTGPTQWQFLCRTMACFLASSIFIVHFIASDFAGNLFLKCKAGNAVEDLRQCPDLTSYWNKTLWSFGDFMFWGAVIGALVYYAGWILAKRHKQDRVSLVLWAVSGGIYGILTAAGLYVYLVIPDRGIGGIPVPFMHLVFGVPYLLVAQFLADTVFVGLTSYQAHTDADREWFGRASGWLLSIAALWLIFSLLLYFGSVLAHETLDSTRWATLANAILPLFAAASGLITALISKSAATPVQGETRGRLAYLGILILPVTGVMFVAALIIIISYVIDLSLLGESLTDAWDHASSSKFHDSEVRSKLLTPLFLGFIVFAALSFVASLCVNINRFSLHAIYRNRLARAFLGAARKRNPDPFTGFDFDDNIRMSELWDEKRKQRPWRPFQIVNIALNVVSSDNLAWQERKAEPFTVSPLHCGSSRLGYRKTREYGGSGNGITLGTALAISGAAASPNMGYYSSLAVTFLMSMLNVRLGWWLGNPGPKGDEAGIALQPLRKLNARVARWLGNLEANPKHGYRGAAVPLQLLNSRVDRWLDKLASRDEPSYRKDGPDFAILPLLAEAFGLTTDNRRYVYLSDGGHFEDLGLYEMVRRRCRFIVVSDASCDPEFSFWDLGNAVRKISIDLGVSIRLLNLDLLSNVNDEPIGGKHLYHAIGEIDYQSADGGGSNGYLLYIKPARHGIENSAVRAYAAANPEFPHQRTMNQWFAESQFESYRALGFEITDRVVSDALRNGLAPNASLQEILEALYSRAHVTAAGGPVCEP